MSDFACATVAGRIAGVVVAAATATAIAATPAVSAAAAITYPLVVAVIRAVVIVVVVIAVDDGDDCLASPEADASATGGALVVALVSSMPLAISDVTLMTLLLGEG